MTTKIQCLKKNCSKNRKFKKKALEKCPQKKGTCMKVFITTPKKPNSAARKTIKVILSSNKIRIQCHIPGIGHTLQRYSTVLIHGATVKDLPCIKYRAIRGKFDLKKVYDRKKARSKYGISKIK
jgi:small subunit ribosomal protein S12